MYQRKQRKSERACKGERVPWLKCPRLKCPGLKRPALNWPPRKRPPLMWNGSNGKNGLWLKCPRPICTSPVDSLQVRVQAAVVARAQKEIARERSGKYSVWSYSLFMLIGRCAIVLVESAEPIDEQLGTGKYSTRFSHVCTRSTFIKVNEDDTRL